MVSKKESESKGGMGEVAVVTGNEYLTLQTEMSELQDLIDGCLDGGDEQPELDRIKVPGGGGMQWEIPGAGKMEMAATFDGIIVGFQSTRAYWSSEFTGEGTPPDCRSQDGKSGVGNPGGDCETCPLNAWGTGKNGMGTACAERKLVYILRADDTFPVVLSVPVTSLKSLRQYRNRLLRERKVPTAVVTRFGLERVKSTTGITYSQVTFTKVGSLPVDMAPLAKAYAKTIKTALGLAHEEPRQARSPLPVSEGMTDDIPDADPPFGRFGQPAKEESETPF